MHEPFQSTRFLVLTVLIDVGFLAVVNGIGRVDPIVVGFLILVVSPVLAYVLLRTVGSGSEPD